LKKRFVTSLSQINFFFSGIVARQNDLKNVRNSRSEKFVFSDEVTSIHNNFNSVEIYPENADSGFAHSSIGSAQTIKTEVKFSSGDAPSNAPTNVAMTSSGNDDVFSLNNGEPAGFSTEGEEPVAGTYWSKDTFAEKERLSHSSNDTGCEIDLDLPDSPCVDSKLPCCKTISKDSGMSNGITLAAAVS